LDFGRMGAREAALARGSDFKVIVLSSGAIGPKSNTHRCFPTVGWVFVGIHPLFPLARVIER